VSFTPPAGPVGGYRVVALPGGPFAFGTASPIIVPGLTNGATYTFRVIAANDGGWGPASAPSSPIVVGAATTPTDVAAIGGDGSAQVSWGTPVSDGGSPITGYLVTPYVGTVAQTPVAVGVVTAATLTGLTNGKTYTFTVTALNAIGPGVTSAASNPVTPALPREPFPEPPAPTPRPDVPAVTVTTGVRPPPPSH
jgi:hypothetical protein